MKTSKVFPQLKKDGGMVKHQMSLFAEPFERVKSGRKIIEVSIGDSVIFERLPDRNENVTVEVTGLSRFNSFRSLIELC